MVVEQDMAADYSQELRPEHDIEVQAMQVQRTASLVATAPSTETDIDLTDEEYERRIQWIKYYVRIGEPLKARALGWDGKPFLGMGDMVLYAPDVRFNRNV